MRFTLDDLEIDLAKMPEAAEVDLEEAFLALSLLYDQVDSLLQKSTADLALPCKRGCSACCRDSVFATPLEFLYLWAWAFHHLPPDEIADIVRKGVELSDRYGALIDALEGPPPEGDDDHFRLVADLHYDCPMLGDDGQCRTYPARELYARLFGSSFDRQGHLYACTIIRQHLYGREVTLVQAPDVARVLDSLPLTQKRQIFPYYFRLFYGHFSRNA